MPWLDTVIVIVIVIVGLVIMYRALKEPLDMVGRGIAKMFGGIRDKIADNGGGYETIQYG